MAGPFADASGLSSSRDATARNYDTPAAGRQVACGSRLEVDESGAVPSGFRGTTSDTMDAGQELIL
jgi:hypothetical protein